MINLLFLIFSSGGVLIFFPIVLKGYLDSIKDKKYQRTLKNINRLEKELGMVQTDFSEHEIKNPPWNNILLSKPWVGATGATLMVDSLPAAEGAGKRGPCDYHRSLGPPWSNGMPCIHSRGEEEIKKLVESAANTPQNYILLSQIDHAMKVGREYRQDGNWEQLSPLQKQYYRAFDQQFE